MFDYLSKDLSLKVLDILKDLKQENTILVITKNKEIIESNYVDNIIVLDDSKILTEGKHDELLKESEYKKIFKKL
ncbi:MAG: ABC transporter ATP-binding protein [Bacilli bacterium]|nr:ABC transporter ATP-binding protein [Bacilli bacterium]